MQLSKGHMKQWKFNSIIKVYQVKKHKKEQGTKGPQAPTLGRHVSACATILACVTLVRALVYCNFLRKVRLGGWGSRGPKGLT